MVSIGKRYVKLCRLMRVSGIYYLMFATFPGNILSPSTTRTVTDILRPDLFSVVYHFNTGMSGLAYIGIGFGFLFATACGVKLSDKIYIYVCQDCILL